MKRKRTVLVVGIGADQLPDPGADYGAQADALRDRIAEARGEAVEVVLVLGASGMMLIPADMTGAL